MRGSKVMVLGMAYKKDVADPRESPAFEVIDLLLGQGVDVCYHDPHVPIAPGMRSWPDLPPMESRELDEATLSSMDAVVVITAHEAIDWEMVERCAPLIIDTRGVYREDRSNVVRA